MEKPQLKRIAIIGAGWCGLGCLQELLKAGHLIDVYEQHDDVGGTWHSFNRYAGLKIHDAVKQIEYADVPLSNNIDKSERVTSEQIFKYMQDVCNAKGLYKYIFFNKTVLKIKYHSAKKKSTIHIEDALTKGISTEEYDYVINTYGYTSRNLPDIPNKQEFTGEIIHSFDVNNEKLFSYIANGKTITLLGASKTATDFALQLYKYGCRFNWLYRKPYWFMRFDPLRNHLNKRSEKGIGNVFYMLCLFVGMKMSHWPKWHYWLWRSSNVIHTFGKKHTDFKKFHFGWIDDAQMSDLKRLNKRHGIQGEIKACEKNGIRLQDNRLITTDVLICCTGSGANKQYIEFEIEDKKLKLDDVYDVYRSAVIPQIPNLIFTAYHNFFIGTVNGLCYGKWIAKYIEFAPDKDYLIKNSEKYDYPFFSHHYISDSSVYYITNNNSKMEPFFASGEVDRNVYTKWLVHSFVSNAPAKPLEFKLPRIKKDNQ